MFRKRFRGKEGGAVHIDGIFCVKTIQINYEVKYCHCAAGLKGHAFSLIWKISCHLDLPSIFSCCHERRPTIGRSKGPCTLSNGRFEEVSQLSLLVMNLHEVYTLCRHLCLPSLHQHVEEADSTIVSPCGVGLVCEEHLQRRHVVIHWCMEEEVAFTLKC